MRSIARCSDPLLGKAPELSKMNNGRAAFAKISRSSRSTWFPRRGRVSSLAHRWSAHRCADRQRGLPASPIGGWFRLWAQTVAPILRYCGRRVSSMMRLRYPRGYGGWVPGIGVLLLPCNLGLRVCRKAEKRVCRSNLSGSGNGVRKHGATHPNSRSKTRKIDGAESRRRARM